MQVQIAPQKMPISRLWPHIFRGIELRRTAELWNMASAPQGSVVFDSLPAALEAFSPLRPILITEKFEFGTERTMLLRCVGGAFGFEGAGKGCLLRAGSARRGEHPIYLTPVFSLCPWRRTNASPDSPPENARFPTLAAQFSPCGPIKTALA
jgi:hypothetical protein